MLSQIGRKMFQVVLPPWMLYSAAEKAHIMKAEKKTICVGGLGSTAGLGRKRDMILTSIQMHKAFKPSAMLVDVQY
jgi:hypothetical protein